MSTNLAFAQRLNLVVHECITCGVSFGMPGECAVDLAQRIVRRLTAEHKELVPVERDQWGRPSVYFAEVRFSNGGGNHCAFTTRDEAIYFVKEQLSLMEGVEWAAWICPRGKYPYETDRDNPNLTPTFIATFGKAKGTVEKLTAMTEWMTAERQAAKEPRD